MAKSKLPKLTELEKWFNEQELPETLKLNGWITIPDLKKCVNNNIEVLKHNSGKRAFMPYYKQLIEIKKRLETLKK